LDREEELDVTKQLRFNYYYNSEIIAGQHKMPRLPLKKEKRNLVSIENIIAKPAS
jgi:hypothetical protein